MMRNELIEVLEDLKHDLGKYLVMPLSMLEDGADQAAIRAAIDDALHRTRRGPDGARSASELWTDFQAEVGERWLAEQGGVAVRDAVERALAWSQLLAGEGPLVRERALADFRAVGERVGGWLAELRSGIDE